MINRIKADLAEQLKESEISIDPLQVMETKEGSDGKFHLTKDAEGLIHNAFKEFCELDNPNVIIFASCYSFYSEIKHLMRSAGLLSVVSMQEDRGEISFGKMFQLGQEQKEVLDELARNRKIKDVIIKGKYLALFLSTFLKH